MRSSFLITLFCATIGALASSEESSNSARAAKESKKDSKFNKANAGPPPSLFCANETLPVAKLKAAVKRAHKIVDNYPVTFGRKSPRSNIYGDWSKFEEGSAYVYTADMDIDCDGLNHKCPGNQDGSPSTNFGALSSFAVPYVVIPDRFHNKHRKELPGNNVVGVICNGKLLYGIFGDTDGDTPQVIGEASWAMAHACFPKEGLHGNKGHAKVDVTYIFFTGKKAIFPSDFLGIHFLTDFGKLQSMGNKLVGKLLQNLDN